MSVGPLMGDLELYIHSLSRLPQEPAKIPPEEFGRLFVSDLPTASLRIDGVISYIAININNYHLYNMLKINTNEGNVYWISPLSTRTIGNRVDFRIGHKVRVIGEERVNQDGPMHRFVRAYCLSNQTTGKSYIYQ